MSKFNYSKQFAKKETNVEVAEENKVVTTDVENEVVTEEIADVEPQVEEVTIKTGVVSNCARLRVRKGPSKQSAVIAVINENTKVTIEEELASWYKVRVSGNIFGYCAAEFITIK